MFATVGVLTPKKTGERAGTRDKRNGAVGHAFVALGPEEAKKMTKHTQHTNGTKPTQP